jgi:oligoendopeptidase F
MTGPNTPATKTPGTTAVTLPTSVLSPNADSSPAEAVQLGPLPNWNLSDLYPSPSAPEIEQDLKRAASQAGEFKRAYEGKLSGLSGADFLTAVQQYESLQELMGRLMSYAQLAYAGNMADPELARFQQNVSERVNAISVEVLFFTLEINKLDDADL